MLSFLPPLIRGIISLLLYTFILSTGSIAILIIALLSLIPFKPWQRLCQYGLELSFDYWSITTNFIMYLTMKIEWDVKGSGDLKKNEWYFLISNHKSWVDILVIFRVFHNKIPLLKFFMKRELLWSLPIAGLACWAMGNPFMKRYSKSFLAKHPELKGKDIETTRKACERFKKHPNTIANFLEGTRFTADKYTRQNSPYKHLLTPKAGGLAFSFEALAGIMHYIVNTTIIYPDPKISFWHFMCGRISKIIVRYEVIPFPSNLVGNYNNDPEYRVKFQRWVNQLWQEKDQLIDQYVSPPAKVH